VFFVSFSFNMLTNCRVHSFPILTRQENVCETLQGTAVDSESTTTSTSDILRLSIIGVGQNGERVSTSHWERSPIFLIFGSQNAYFCCILGPPSAHSLVKKYFFMNIYNRRKIWSKRIVIFYLPCWACLSRGPGVAVPSVPWLIRWWHYYARHYRHVCECEGSREEMLICRPSLRVHAALVLVFTRHS